MDHTLMFC